MLHCLNTVFPFGIDLASSGLWKLCSSTGSLKNSVFVKGRSDNFQSFQNSKVRWDTCTDPSAAGLRKQNRKIRLCTHTPIHMKNPDDWRVLFVSYTKRKCEQYVSSRSHQWRLVSHYSSRITANKTQDMKSVLIYEGCLKNSWTGGSAPLLCRGRRWLLCQVVVVGVKKWWRDLHPSIVRVWVTVVLKEPFSEWRSN
jgi:hypothetical protein